jgi:hypothetical protein
MIQHFLSRTSKSAGSRVVRQYHGGESLHYKEEQDYFPGSLLQDFQCGTVLGGGNCIHVPGSAPLTHLSSRIMLALWQQMVKLKTDGET